MAVYTPARVYLGQPTNSESTLYTVPSSTQVIIKQIHISNTTSAAATFSLSLVPTGGAAGVANRLFTNISVAGNSIFQADMVQVMNATDFISGIQGTSGALTIAISGVTVV